MVLLVQAVKPPFGDLFRPNAPHLVWGARYLLAPATNSGDPTAMNMVPLLSPNVLSELVESGAALGLRVG